MAQLNTKGYGHRCTQISDGVWQLSWTFDTKIRRVRYPRTIRRLTDFKGAVRFVKKWGLKRV